MLYTKITKVIGIDYLYLYVNACQSKESAHEFEAIKRVALSYSEETVNDYNLEAHPTYKNTIMQLATGQVY